MAVLPFSDQDNVFFAVVFEKNEGAGPILTAGSEPEIAAPFEREDFNLRRESELIGLFRCEGLGVDVGEQSFARYRHRSDTHFCQTIIHITCRDDRKSIDEL